MTLGMLAANEDIDRVNAITIRTITFRTFILNIISLFMFQIILGRLQTVTSEKKIIQNIETRRKLKIAFAIRYDLFMILVTHSKKNILLQRHNLLPGHIFIA